MGIWLLCEIFANILSMSTDYSAGNGIDRTIGLFWRNSGCSTEQKTLRVCRSTDHPKSPEFPAPFPHPCAMPPSPAPMKRYYIEWNRNIDIYLGSLSVIFLSSCRSCGTLSYSLCLKGHGNEPNFSSFLH
jgi:hypothetical protein